MHFSFSSSTVLYNDTCVNVQGLHMSSLPGYVVSSFFYRECCGPCKCRLPYDGQEDLMLNINNKVLVEYDVLFTHLHGMLKGRNPLATFHR